MFTGKKREARDGRDVLTCLDGLGFQGQSSYHLRFEWTMKAKLSTSRMPHLRCMKLRQTELLEGYWCQSNWKVNLCLEAKWGVHYLYA